MRILLAEDEKLLSKALVKVLERNHYSVDAAFDGEEALAYLETGNYDIAVLDIMMPKKDGMEVLRTARQGGNRIPILMLTAKADIEDRVQGLDSGANDYLTKPFDTRELLARIRSLTRSTVETDGKLSLGNVTLDRATFELASPTGSIRLANKEYQMMEFLMANPHRILPTARFMERIWGYDSDTEINVVWVYISYLRKKLAALQADIQIQSVRNAGFSLEEKDV